MASSFEQILEKGLEMVGAELSPTQMDQIGHHYQQLQLWNKKINLTAIREPDKAAEKHFIDCIMAIRRLPSGNSVIDIGSGGGFPGIVLKILNPDIRATLVDASRKKVNFLKQVIRTAGLEAIDAVHTRVEDLHHDSRFAKRYDMAVSRAFSELDRFVALSQPLLNPQGVICAMKGRSALDEISPSVQARYDIKTHHYQLPFEKSDRHLILLQMKKG